MTPAERPHPFPSRTRKLSSPAPKILRGQPFGKIGRRRDFCVSGGHHPRSRPRVARRAVRYAFRTMTVDPHARMRPTPSPIPRDRARCRSPQPCPADPPVDGDPARGHRPGHAICPFLLVGATARWRSSAPPRARASLHRGHAAGAARGREAAPALPDRRRTRVRHLHRRRTEARGSARPSATTARPAAPVTRDDPGRPRPWPRSAVALPRWAARHRSDRRRWSPLLAVAFVAVLVAAARVGRRIGGPGRIVPRAVARRPAPRASVAAVATSHGRPRSRPRASTDRARGSRSPRARRWSRTEVEPEPVERRRPQDLHGEAGRHAQRDRRDASGRPSRRSRSSTTSRTRRRCASARS